MKVNLTNCRDCGAVVRADEYDGLCRECAVRRVERMETLYRVLDRLDDTELSMEKLAEASGLTPEEVRQLLRKTPALRRDLARKEARVCTRCRKDRGRRVGAMPLLPDGAAGAVACGYDELWSTKRTGDANSCEAGCLRTKNTARPWRKRSSGNGARRR